MSPWRKEYNADPYAELDMVKERMARESAMMQRRMDEMQDSMRMQMYPMMQQPQATMSGSRFVHDPRTNSYRVEHDYPTTAPETTPEPAEAPPKEDSELSQFRKFFNNLTPVLEKLDENPSLVEKIINFTGWGAASSTTTSIAPTEDVVKYTKRDDTDFNRSCVGCGRERHDGTSCPPKPKTKFCGSCGEVAHGANLGKYRNKLCDRVKNEAQTIHAKKVRKVFWHRRSRS